MTTHNCSEGEKCVGGQLPSKKRRKYFRRQLTVSAINSDAVYRARKQASFLLKDNKFPFGCVKIQILIGLLNLHM